MIEPYTIQNKCGSGALSDVFKAIDKNGEVVAIKSLKVFFKEEGKIKERITKEASILKELRDEKIVKYKDFFFDQNGAPSLVVEYVDGKDLSFHIKNLDSQKIPLIGSQLVSEILLGLEEVHRFGYIHRDLKPENIMLTSDGKIKITDFGLARNLESHDLTLSGTILGSPIFMSPEQCKGDNIDHRSDIFSLGVLLYYFATMTYPFMGESYPMIAKAIIQDEPISPMQLNPFIDKSLNDIILKALAKDPNKRYQKVYEMRNDLMQFLDEFKVSHHSKVFKEFIDNDLSEEASYQKKLVAKYTLLLKKHEAEKNSKAPFYLNQLLKIDPLSEDIQKLSQASTVTSSKENSSKYLVALILLFIFFAGVYFYSKTSEEIKPIAQVKKDISTPVISQEKPAPIIQSKPVVKNDQPKPIIGKTKTIETPIAAKEESPQAAPVTGIHFTLPSDTRVYVDDVEVVTKDVYRVNPGKHRIKMIKNNFTPIESDIEVLSDKVTRINVGE